MESVLSLEVRDEPVDVEFEAVPGGETAPSPLIQGAGCAGCLATRYLPFTRSCSFWWNQYALAI